MKSGIQGLTSLAESVANLWTEAAESITQSRLQQIFLRLPTDDELSTVPLETLREARLSLESEPDLTWRSSDERTAVVLAAAARVLFSGGTAVMVIWLTASFLSWTSRTWAATADGDADTHATRFAGELLSALDWPTPWLALIGFALLTTMSVGSWLVHRGMLAALDTRLDTLARPMLREFVNTNTNTNRAPILNVTRAPALTQISPVDHLVDRPELHRIRRLITELGANSVAISGSRGSGKTTLLRNITHEPGRSAGETNKWLQLHMTAPVGYNSQDFLIHLYIRLCESVREYLHFGPKTAPRWLYGIRRGLRFVVRSIITLALLAVIQEAFVYPALDAKTQDDRLISAIHEFTVQQLDRIGVQLPGGWLLAGVIIGLLISNLLATGIGRRSPRSGVLRSLWGTDPRELERITNQNLARLRFIQTTNSTWSTTLKASRLEIGGGRSRQLAEVPLSLPELVDSYRNYVSQVASWWRPGAGTTSIAVTIDEMDRISDPSQAERFLNDIKAIFNIPGCIYLVSVSEDALSGFESRVVHMRTAMDSSFDEVIRLPAFTLEQSLDLIRRRVVGFPDVFTALCHCVAGGVPRDLLRAARTLIELRRDTQADRLAQLAQSLVDAEIASLRRGLAARLAHEEHAVGAELAPHLVDERHRQTSSEIFTELTAIGKVRAEGDAQLAARLGAGLQYFAAVLELFEGSRTFIATAVSDPTSQERLLIDKLARTRATLQVGPALAAAQLDELQRTIRAARRPVTAPASS
ncbi:hypothetical protein [Kribbella speibonae]|uniref:KAP NTPase domain-containing protein n=1 Tax=Kribbella speibonae TaxID=1572660 RepID=A0ABY2A2V3_9ACTN|nr:hypothetical protein [Kribbella speibonae]TCC20840.1 hypothetical protein E0H58_26205 [Kribbella speibonae]